MGSLRNRNASTLRKLPKCPTGISGLDAIMGGIPTQVYGALPYIVTIIILAGVVGRSVAPAAVGKPYQKEGRAA